MDAAKLQSSPLFKVHKFAFLAQKALDQELQAKVGVTFSQFHILFAAGHMHDVSQREIATCRDMTEAAVSRHVDSLSERGLLVRKPKADGKRGLQVELTAAGAKAVRMSEELIDTMSKRMLEGLSEAQIGLLGDIFDGFIGKIKA